MGGDTVADLTAGTPVRTEEGQAGSGPDAVPTVKCLVWDLDNTLWKGILLEDGQVEVADGVREVIEELDARGVLQSVASKNDWEPAWQRLEELGLAEYFVLPQIGWWPKSESIRRIADRLRFATATVAFVDDQPAERAEVNHHLADVRCYGAEQISSFLDLPDFTPATVTEDARRRREMYQSSFRREAAREDFSGPDEDFLRSLELVMHIRRASGDDLVRVEELTLRTSQMNATGVHYSHDTLDALRSDPRHEVLVVSMADRFGSHGSVGIVLLELGARSWHLKLLATSCRVVSFGAGTVLLNWLVGQAAQRGVHLVADFRRTERNRMMEVTYRFAGFTDQECACTDDRPPPEGDAEAPAVERLHLVPDERPEPTTMKLHAPALGEGAEGKGDRG